MLTDRRMIFFLGRVHFLVLSSLLIAFAVLETSSARVLADSGTTKVAVKKLNEHSGVSQAGNSSVYFFDLTATDSHGQGTLMVNVKKQKFVFNGKGFKPDKDYFLYHRGTTDFKEFGSAVSTPSGNLHVEGSWEGVDLPAAEAFSVIGMPAPPLDNLNNLDSVIKNKDEMIKTGEDIKAGKLKTGGFSGSGAVFGLANMVVQKYRYDTIMDELNTMDSKVDVLLTDVAAIQNQLAGIVTAIEKLQDYITYQSILGPVQSDAEQWIAEFFHDLSETQQSYNWARWKLAGCDVSSTTCDQQVTEASQEEFAKMFAKNPTLDPPDIATDNFLLWWAYGVQATLAEGISYTKNGNTARNLVDSIHYALVHDAGTSQNALRAYMEFVFEQSNCATDVTGCDLYAEVYGPVEAYFQQLISDQITLVQAIVESFSVLASAHQDTLEYDSSISDYLTGANGVIQKLSEEVEVFVQTAEQIALYRAADGRFDWGSFGTSDAARLLARADFVAARIVSSPTGKPWPWPPGMTGRIFYTDQQPLPSTTFHKACQGTNCTTLTEVVPEEMPCHLTSVPDLCYVNGDWPYLQWQLDSTGSIASGTPTYTWKLRRLVPQPLEAGTYQVASVNSQYGTSNLVVAQYGYDYTNPPADPTETVPFGSFNNVEGKLGIGALGANRTYSGGSDNKLRDFTVTKSTNYTEMSVAYKTSDSYGNADWYEYMNVTITDTGDPVFDTYPRVRLFWPTTLETSLGEYTITSSSCCWDHYYQEFEQTLQLLDGSSVITGASKTWSDCGTYDFNSCNLSHQNPLESTPLTLVHGKKYTLKAHFHDKIYGYYYCTSGRYQYLCKQGPTSGSYATWTVFNPTFTLTK